MIYTFVAGAEFICENKDCHAYNQSINIYDKWPCVNIDKWLEVYNESDTESYASYKKYKEFGRKYAKIILPNTKLLNIEAFSIIGIDLNNKKIQEFDIPIDEYSMETHKKILYDNNMSGFQEAVESGLLCPFCKTPMKQTRWISNYA